MSDFRDFWNPFYRPRTIEIQLANQIAVFRKSVNNRTIDIKLANQIAVFRKSVSTRTMEVYYKKVLVKLNIIT